MTKKKTKKKARRERTLKDVVGEGITLRSLLDAANAYYPDKLLAEFYSGKGDAVAFDQEASGDTLAEAIVTSIIDTYRSGSGALDKVDAALHVIDRLVEDLNRVERGLMEGRERIEPGGTERD